MKLNYDCIRDILLVLEEIPYCYYQNGMYCFDDVSIDDIFSSLEEKGYSREDVFYSIFNLDQADFISANFTNVDGGIVRCSVEFITYEGHEFIEQIKPDTVWNKTKGVVKNIGSASLSIISKIASDVIIGLIKTQIV